MEESSGILETYSYGVTPKEPERVWGEVAGENYLSAICTDHTGETDAPELCEKFQKSKVCYESKTCIKLQKIKVCFENENRIFSIPVEVYMPAGKEKYR